MEGRPEVSAIDRVMPRGLRVVNVLTFGAVEFYVGGAGNVVLAAWEEMLRFTDHSRAFTEDSLFVLFHLVVILARK